MIRRVLVVARLVACAVLIVAPAALAQNATTIGNANWSKPYPPFKILGNLYWVGTYDLSTYLITTPQGHILINTGLADSVPQIKANVEALGFKMSDVKILTATHGHFDHVAGLAALEKMTGAEVWVSAPEAELLETGGKADFRWGDDAGARFEPVKVDRRLEDGASIALGGAELTLHIHAGHTKGSSTFTFNVRENGKTYRVGIVNMGSINPGVKLSGMPGFPNIADAYARTFRDQKEMKIDVWLASHASQIGLHDKHKPGDPYNPDRFVDPQGFRTAVERLEQAYLKQLATEKTTALTK